MPRSKPKSESPVRREYGDVVEARADLSFGRRWIPKGTRLSRTGPAVVADAGGHHFQIPAVPLSEVLERGR
jgi:hypothetical protein